MKTKIVRALLGYTPTSGRSMALLLGSVVVTLMAMIASSGFLKVVAFVASSVAIAALFGNLPSRAWPAALVGLVILAISLVT